MRKKEGITLIALVVTIIVLLILAGISIATLTGQNGIITRTNDARRENVKGAEREQISLAYGTEKSFLLETGSTEGVSAEALENRLRSDGAKITSVEEEDGKLKITFDTGNIYYIDSDGNITEGTPSEPPAPPALGEIEVPQRTIEEDFSKPYGVVEIAWLDLNNNVIAKPLSPNIGNMQKVAWDSSNNEITPTSNSDWYDYHNKKWANAKNLEDGSYFVWIPRYAYKIIYFDTEENKNAYVTNNSSKTGIIGYSTIHGITNLNGELTQGTQINISDTVKTEGYRDYIPHPGFLGTGYEDLGGGFGNSRQGIKGMWIAKFEMSREDSTNSGATWNPVTTVRETGNVATRKAGASNDIRAVSKPGVSNWKYINIANCYENAYYYDRDKDSHLMKNSEWGAAAYLFHSKYGRNAEEIEVESFMNDYTGGGAGEAYKNNTENSSTGNAFGIYDLNGNAWEYVAGYNKAYKDDFFGSSFYSEKGNMFAVYNGVSNKYATVYNNSTDSFYQYFNDGDVSHVGDAIREVWVHNDVSWNSDMCRFVNKMLPFFSRGGYYGHGTQSGVFSTHDFQGMQYDIIGYRVSLII